MNQTPKWVHLIMVGLSLALAGGIAYGTLRTQVAHNARRLMVLDEVVRDLAYVKGHLDRRWGKLPQ